MNLSQAGIDFIKLHEGCRLEAYQDSGGVFTIGVGHVGSGVVEGLHITDAEADEFLRHDLQIAEKCVNNSVKVDLSQNQFDACVSLVFNIGCRAFGKSTLLRKLNEGYDDQEVAKEFLRWVYDDHKVVHGLQVRRADEMQLFLA